MAINEGQTVQYTVITTRVTDGTVLYWKTTGNTTNSDIVGGNTGSVTITNNQGVFNVTTSLDINTDGAKTIGISLSNSLNGTSLVQTSVPVVVNDTSLSPAKVLYVWGAGNTNLGTNDSINRSSPTQIGGTTWRSIKSGIYTSLATKEDGTLWSWGSNSFGQLGTSTGTGDTSSPTQVGTGTTWNFVNINGYSNVTSVKTDGTLWAWGQNSYGNLGLNDTVHRSSPVQVGSDTNWAAVPWTSSSQSSWFHLVATKTNGTLWMCGFNTFTQLGLGVDNVDRSSPVQVGTLTNWPTTAQKISTGWAYTMAIKSNGTLWGWGADWVPGRNLGLNGSVVYTNSPIQVGTLTNWATIACGRQQTIATKTDGTLWSWGLNTNGQLGQNNTVTASSPVQIGTDTNWAFAQINTNFAIAVKTNGTLWSWGLNPSGVLGQNNMIARSSPVQIGTNSSWASSYELLSSTPYSVKVIYTQ